MFENLSERLSGVFDRLTKQGALSEDDVKTALREVRVALLEADVSLPVARFTCIRAVVYLNRDHSDVHRGRAVGGDFNSDNGAVHGAVGGCCVHAHAVHT